MAAFRITVTGAVILAVVSFAHDAHATVIDDLMTALNEPARVTSSVPAREASAAAGPASSIIAAPRDDVAVLEELSRTISMLRNRLAEIIAARRAESEMKEQIQQAIPFDPATFADLESGLVTGRTLIRGSRGDDIASLQRFLIAQGFLETDSATGFFGALTERAVQRWQASQGIVTEGDPASTGFGSVGKQTRAAMLAALRAGQESSGTADTEVPAVDETGVDVPEVSDHDASIAPLPENAPDTPAPLPQATQSEATAAGAATQGALSPQSSQPLSCQLDGVSVGPNATATAYQSPTAPAGQACVSEIRSCSGGALTGSYAFASCSAAPDAVPIGSFDVVAIDGSGTPYLSGWAYDPDASSTSLVIELYEGGPPGTGTKLAGGSTTGNAPNINALYGITGLHRFRYNLPSSAGLAGEYRMYAVDAETGASVELDSSPRIIAAGADCTQDGVTVPNGFSHVFYSSAAVASPDSCTSVDLNRTCSDGVLSGAARYQYAACTASTAAALDGISQIAAVLEAIRALLSR